MNVKSLVKVLGGVTLVIAGVGTLSVSGIGAPIAAAILAVFIGWGLMKLLSK